MFLIEMYVGCDFILAIRNWTLLNGCGSLMGRISCEWQVGDKLCEMDVHFVSFVTLRWSEDVAAVRWLELTKKLPLGPKNPFGLFLNAEVERFVKENVIKLLLLVLPQLSNNTSHFPLFLFLGDFWSLFGSPISKELHSPCFIHRGSCYSKDIWFDR